MWLMVQAENYNSLQFQRSTIFCGLWNTITACLFTISTIFSLFLLVCLFFPIVFHNILYFHSSAEAIYSTQSQNPHIFHAYLPVIKKNALWYIFIHIERKYDTSHLSVFGSCIAVNLWQLTPINHTGACETRHVLLNICLLQSVLQHSSRVQTHFKRKNSFMDGLHTFYLICGCT